MIRLVSVATLLSLAAAVQTPTPVTPASPAHENLYRASVEDVAVWVVNGSTSARPVIEIDPRVLGRPSRGMPAPTETLHPAAMLAGAAVPDKVIVMTVPRAQQCSGIGIRNCRTAGRVVVLTFAAPVIDADSATIEVLVRLSRKPTDAELARMQQGRNSEAVLARFGEEAGSVTMMRLSLARRNGAWSVTSRTIIGQS